MRHLCRLYCRQVNVTSSDTPQFCGVNPYFFSENPCQSVSFIYASMYRENVHAIHIAMQFAKKISTLCNKNRQPAANNHNRSHRRTGQHPFGRSNRVLPEWRTQIVCRIRWGGGCSRNFPRSPQTDHIR